MTLHPYEGGHTEFAWFIVAWLSCFGFFYDYSSGLFWKTGSSLFWYEDKGDLPTEYNHQYGLHPKIIEED